MKQEIIEVPLSRLKDDPENPRMSIEEAEEMADSLEEHGQLVPILTYPSGKDYVIQAGHRRKAGFTVLQKRTGKEPMVKIIVEDKKLSKDDLLLKKCAMDAQQKNLTVPERDAAWKRLWNVWKKSPKFEKEGKAGFARMLGATTHNVTNFVDRMELGDDLIKTLNKKGVGSDVISETKGLDEPTRKELLNLAAKEDLGCREVRQIKQTIRDASAPVKKAVLARTITVENARKLNDMPEEKQKDTIEIMKSMKNNLDSVPTLMKTGKITSVKEKKLVMDAKTYVYKLSSEVRDTANQISAIEATLEVINKGGYAKHFGNAGKKRLADGLERLNTCIKSAVVKIEKQIKEWRD